MGIPIGSYRNRFPIGISYRNRIAIGISYRNFPVGISYRNSYMMLYRILRILLLLLYVFTLFFIAKYKISVTPMIDISIYIDIYILLSTFNWSCTCFVFC